MNINNNNNNNNNNIIINKKTYFVKLFSNGKLNTNLV